MSFSVGGSDPLLFGTLVFVLTTALVSFGCGGLPPIDDDLCPDEQEPVRTTVLLLDTSDPLTPKLREELERLVMELTGARGSAKSGFLVAPGEALVVYELPGDLSEIEPVIRVCNPGGNPDDWSMKDGLTKGQVIALRQWQNFLDAVQPLFDREEAQPQSLSPIIETLGVIVPRHATSRRSSSAAVNPVHLILYSDLLQHSEHLSHYGTYPSPAEVKKNLRHLQTDLSGVEVSLYRLERSGDADWQTADHYYWWTKLIQEFGGKIIFQESV